MAKVLITDTILRDAHQSQAATRMRLEDMLPACPTETPNCSPITKGSKGKSI